MTQAYYTYKEALDIAEDFMIKSGIRRYCENICRGKCCGEVWDEEEERYIPCWKSKVACWRNEGRRLPCSVYLCGSLLDISPDADYLHDLRQRVFRILDNIMGINPYFNPNTEDIQRKFRIPKEELEVLKSIDVKRYRRIMKFLRKNHIQIYDLPSRYKRLLKHRISRMKTGGYATTPVWGWHWLKHIKR